MRREFKAVKMKESESVKDFTDRLLNVVTQIRLLGEKLKINELWRKFLCVSSREVWVENFLSKKIKFFQKYQLQSFWMFCKQLILDDGRRHWRCFCGTHKWKSPKLKKFWVKAIFWGGRRQQERRRLEKNFTLPPSIKCRAYNQFGHVEKVCKNKANQQAQQAQVVEHEEQIEEHLFVATCCPASNTKEVWLRDSGCKNHMTHNA